VYAESRFHERQTLVGNAIVPYTMQRTVLYGAAGVLIAIVILAATPYVMPLVATGTLVVQITDAPADLRHLNMTIDHFEAHNNETEEWVNVPIEAGAVSFDLLTLDGVTLDAAIAQLEPGNYTMIRMHVVAGFEFTNATIIHDDGSVEDVNVKVPSEKLRILVRFEIKEGETTTVLLDIQADTVSIANNPQHNVNPVIKATIIPPTV
jgi:hypothetical protein